MWDVRTCAKCQGSFPNRCLVNGRMRSLTKRKFCLSCSPYGSHNTKSHLGSERDPTSLPWKDSQLVEAVRQSLSISSAIRVMGLAVTGNQHRQVKRRIKELGIPTDHFDPQADRNVGYLKIRTPDSLVYCLNSNFRHLSLRVLEDKSLPYVCQLCRNDGTHNGMPLTLQLDHINGVRNDNRLENLRFLCPNCHTQTPTWGAKRRVPKIKPTICRPRKADHAAVVSRYLENPNYLAVGKEFGISDNAVKKIVVKFQAAGKP